MGNNEHFTIYIKVYLSILHAKKNDFGETEFDRWCHTSREIKPFHLTCDDERL